MNENRTYLDFAKDLAWRAGRITLRYFQTGVAVETKHDASPVTVADRESERFMRDAITAAFPSHGILGEEYDDVNVGASHRWILDPIDGTQSFVCGVPLYGVLVALERDGEVIVGVAHFPGLDETYAAATGEGATWNGRAVRVSAQASLTDAVVVYTDERLFRDYGRAGAWERLRERVGVMRGWSDCYGHCLVATGRADVALEPIMNVWDNAALAPIVREAGGRFTDFDGAARIDGGSAISSNGTLHDDVLGLIAGDAS